MSNRTSRTFDQRAAVADTDNLTPSSYRTQTVTDLVPAVVHQWENMPLCYGPCRRFYTVSD
jgi:hypothetical protein